MNNCPMTFKRYVLIFSVLFLSFIGLIYAIQNNCAEKKQFKCTDEKEDNFCPPVQELLKQMDMGKQIFVELYYFNWRGIYTVIPVTEERIVKLKEYKINHYSVDEEELTKILKKVILTKSDYEEAFHGCRLSVLFYSTKIESEERIKDKMILRLSFSNIAPVMMINGEPYCFRYELFDSMLSYLPYREYIRVKKDLK